MDYDKLKKDTYLFLLGNSIEARKLIYATLLISLCHDKCIKDDKLMVSPSFIKKSDTPTAKARWVLIYIHFQIYSKAYETNEFL